MDPTASQEKSRQAEMTGETTAHKAQRPQGEKIAVQKRTFTRWMNLFLKRREPPVVVQDLFSDVRDGRVLMALLEELSGCRLVHRFRPPTHRIFRLNNIAKALDFLDDRHVKLVGIDASSIADGTPPVVLNLLWNIILFFQIKESKGGIQKCMSSSLSSLSPSSNPSSGDHSPSGDIGTYSSHTLPTKGGRTVRAPRFRGKARKALLFWVQKRTSKFGVEVCDFGKSWRSGLVLLAMIKSIDPALVDLRDCLTRAPTENIEEAFRIAQDSLGIPALLEPEDVVCVSPDERSIITYVSMFLECHSDADEGLATHFGVRTGITELPRDTAAEPVESGSRGHRPEARVLLQSLGETSEQLLWKRWARRSSGEPQTDVRTGRPEGSDVSNAGKTSASRKTNGQAIAPRLNKQSSFGIVQTGGSLGPDSGEADRFGRSRTAEASDDQADGGPCADGGNFSQSSEEGTYSLSALDSDEEDAYSYILDLYKGHLQAHDRLGAAEVAGGRRISKKRPKRESESVSSTSPASAPFQRLQNLPSQTGDVERVGEGRTHAEQGNGEGMVNGGHHLNTEGNGLGEIVVDGEKNVRKCESGNGTIREKETMEGTKWWGDDAAASADDDDAEEGDKDQGEACQIDVRVAKAGWKGSSEEARIEGMHGGGIKDVSKSKGEKWATGSNITLEAEEEEGRSYKTKRNRPREGIEEEKGEYESYHVHTGSVKKQERPADDNVFREGYVRSMVEISERFGFGGRLAVAESIPRKACDESDEDKTTEMSEDVGFVKYAGGEIKAGVFGHATDERREVTGEKHVRMLLERKAARKASRVDIGEALKGDLEKPHSGGIPFILKSSSFKEEKQDIHNNQAASEAITAPGDEHHSNTRTGNGTDVDAKMKALAGEREGMKKDFDEDAAEDGTPERGQNKHLDSKRYRNTATADHGDGADTFPDGRADVGVRVTEESDQNPSSVPVHSEKGASPASRTAPPPGDVTWLERDILLGLWILLYCYFLLHQINL